MKNLIDITNKTRIIPGFAMMLIIIISLFNLNQPLFETINSASNYTGELVWSYLTVLGDPVIVTCIALCFFAYIPAIAMTIVPALILAASSVMFLKWYFGILRPAFVLDNLNLIGETPLSGALPSGHTAGIFALVCCIIFFTQNRSFHKIILGFALLIGLSRVAVGAHWPLDIATGMLTGWACALGGYAIAVKWQHSLITHRLLGILLLLTSLALIGRDTQYPDAFALQLIISIIGILISSIHLGKSLIVKI